MTSPQQGATGTGQKRSASHITLWIEIALLAGVLLLWDMPLRPFLPIFR